MNIPQSPRILVTGASGTLGRRLIPVLHSLFPTAHIVGLYCSHPPITDSNKVTYQRCDITNRDDLHALLEKTQPTIIYHLASMTDVDACEENPSRAESVNVAATIALRDQAPTAHLIFLSSDYVFDGAQGNYLWDDPINPLSVYGCTKARAEQALAVHSRCAIVRTAGIFDWPLARTFLSFVLARLKNSQNAPALSECFYSPIWSSELARAVGAVAERGLTGTIHFGGAERLTRADFARMIARCFGYSEQAILNVDQVNMGWLAKRPQDSSLESLRGYALTGVTPLSLNVSLMECASEMSHIPI